MKLGVDITLVVLHAVKYGNASQYFRVGSFHSSFDLSLLSLQHHSDICMKLEEDMAEWAIRELPD